MNFKTEFFELGQHLRSGVQPSVMITRPIVNARERQSLFLHAQVDGTGKFWVPNGPISPGTDPRWSFCDAGEHVTTLFHAYLTPSVSPATIWPVGLQVGTWAMETFLAQTTDVPDTMYLFCGREVYTKANKLQCLLALAIRVKE